MTVGLLPSLTDEQAMLVDASVRFMEAAWPIASVRAYADGADGPDASYRRTAAELGWLGLFAAEAQGGGTASGNGVLDAALIAAERGARLQPGPFAGHCVAVGALSSTGAIAPATALEPLVQGSVWATCTLDSHSSCALSGDPTGDSRLDGAIPVVADADECAWLLVSARARQGPALLLVAANSPGVTVRRIQGLDMSRHWCTVEFDGVRIGAGALVAEPGGAAHASIERLSQWAAILSAAECVGAMHADFELALRYAKDRIAFGRPIGSFQAVKHLLADTSLWLEMAKAIVGSAATALGTGAPEGPELAHAAKAFVSEKSIELAHNCFQVFGGIGFAWEHDQHLFLRRLAADAECFGSAPWHRARLLDAVGLV